MTTGAETLGRKERERLADVVRLQPTKNRELQRRWEMESGSEIHQYLENHLKEYYFRDEDSLIRATDEAAELVDVEPGIEGGTDEEDEGVPDVVRVPDLERKVFDVVADADERSESVVRVLNKLRETYGIDPEAEAVRGALQSLRRKGVVEVVYRTVPTFRLAVPRDEITVEPTDESPPSYPAYEDGDGDEEVLDTVESEFEGLIEE